MIRQLQRRVGAEGERAATLELFYDLVFVFAITQVSHLLLEHLDWAGAGQALMILLAVWWSWNYTTWATNELNPESNAVRLLLIALMLAGLLMAVAIPDAFGDKGLLFAGAYVTIQVGRHLFLTFVSAAAGSNERERASRILIWFAVAGCFWIAGGIADDGARLSLWLVALALDYGAPLALFWVPGLPRISASAWQLVTGHFAERFGLFIIVALGETVIITGTTTADLDLTAPTVTAFCVAFLGTAALWWLYFTSTQELAEHALAADTPADSGARTQLARDAYTYGHVLLVAGIILSAVGDELVIAHATDPLHPPELTAVVGGPIIYLLAQAVLRLRVARVLSYRRIIGAAACGVVWLVGGHLPALAVSSLLVAVLIAVVLVDERERLRPPALAHPKHRR